MSDDDQRRYRQQAARTGAGIGGGSPEDANENHPTPEPAQTDHPVGEHQANKNIEDESPA